MKNIIIVICAGIAITFSLSVRAEKSYTPKQLQTMIKHGKPPQQGDVETQIRSVSYAECTALMDELIGAARLNYPVEIIVSSSIVRVEKLWINDGAVTMTCSSYDQKMILTRAAYL